jgi:hypothetical protein
MVLHSTSRLVGDSSGGSDFGLLVPLRLNTNNGAGFFNFRRIVVETPTKAKNALLVDLLVRHLSKDFHLYFHRQLSPNDENISFGQLNYWGNM